jgi:hypothetical protein
LVFCLGLVVVGPLVGRVGSDRGLIPCLSTLLLPILPPPRFKRGERLKNATHGRQARVAITGSSWCRRTAVRAVSTAPPLRGSLLDKPPDRVLGATLF